jgi:hypothetical protein
MHGLLDEFLVGGALLASVLYALISLGPRTLKRGVAVRAAALIRSVPTMPGLRSLLRRLEIAAAVKPTGACGGCDDCGSAPPAPESSGSAEPEVRIPVSTIGKRPIVKRPVRAWPLRSR